MATLNFILFLVLVLRLCVPVNYQSGESDALCRVRPPSSTANEPGLPITNFHSPQLFNFRFQSNYKVNRVLYAMLVTLYDVNTAVWNALKLLTRRQIEH